jgi:FKBP-type peptidyl-prolyl cis-trans isomerase
LAYGYEQKGDIQPCSALIFEIEVVDVLQKGETE